jgi:hypothetical protein
VKFSNNTATAETCNVTGAGSGNHKRPPGTLPTSGGGTAAKPTPGGVWGLNPAVGGPASAWDVLPTSFQDNDPIRRPCQGGNSGGTVGTVFNSGEEVCNLDGNLGVVLAIPASAFITAGPPAGMVQYPTVACNGKTAAGVAYQALDCAPFSPGSTHAGECPNGDALIKSRCAVPLVGNASGVNVSSQCFAGFSTKITITSRALNIPNVYSPDGRVFNLFMRDGSTTDGSIQYIHQTIQNGTATPPSIDFAGGMGRIHSVQTIWNDGATGPTAISALALSGPNNVGCQEADVADQIVCLTQADPCSVGYEGDGGKTWGKRQNGVQCTAGTSTTVGANAASSCIQAGVCQTLADAGLCVGTGANGDAPPYTNGTGCPTQCLGTGLVDNQASLALRIDQTYPTQTTVQQLGQQAAEYQIARKLYFSSIVGFQNLQNTANDGSAAGELALAQYMANSPATQINPILTNVGYFLLQGQTTTGGVGGTVPASTFNAPFCEDYNEVTVCGATTANNNGCTANAGQNTFLSEAVGLPSTGSICGDGHQDPYEECDDGVNNGTAGDKCSTTCRCAGTKSYDKVGGTYGCN